MSCAIRLIASPFASIEVDTAGPDTVGALCAVSSIGKTVAIGLGDSVMVLSKSGSVVDAVRGSGAVEFAGADVKEPR